MKRLALFAVVILAAVATAKPDRADPVPKKARPIPQIHGPCRFGDISQEGRKITLAGDKGWYVAQGEIRADHSLLLLWVQVSTGKVAPGLYRIGDDDSITGHWGWGEDVTQDEDGTLRGLTNPETVRPARPPPTPDF